MPQLCGRCGAPSCVVLSTQPLHNSDSGQYDEGVKETRDRRCVTPTCVAAFCVFCGSSMGNCAAARATDAATAKEVVSLSTVFACITALRAEHAEAKDALRRELTELRARASRPPPTTLTPTSTASYSTGRAREEEENVRVFAAAAFFTSSAGPSRSRSPSIVLPPLADSYVPAVGNDAPAICPPPRCSRTLPRHSCSYDSEVDLPFRAAAGQHEPLLKHPACLSDAGRLSTCSPPTSWIPRTRCAAAVDAEELAQRRLQQQAYERLRDALLQQL